MRVTVADFMSLDGVVQAPGGADEDTDGGFAHGGWSMPFFDPETMGAAFDTAVATTEALLFGRRTWQVMAGAWPDRSGDSFADWMNAVPKYVASRTLAQQDLTWNNSALLASDDAIGAIADLRQRPGGDLQVLGSSNLVRQLMSADLVDVISVMIEPILLGGGKRIFPDDGHARTLALADVTRSSTGVLICNYVVQR